MKYFIGITLVVCISILAFYVYAAFQFRAVVIETSLGLVDFLEKDKKTNVNIQNMDSMQKVLNLPGFSALKETLNKDSIELKIIINDK